MSWVSKKETLNLNERLPGARHNSAALQYSPNALKPVRNVPLID